MTNLNPLFYPEVSGLPPETSGKEVYAENGTVGTVTQLAVAYNELVDEVFGKDARL